MTRQRYSFGLQYLASVSKTSHIPLTSPAGFDELQPGASTSNESADLEPGTAMLVQSQEIQVNLPMEGADFGCQFNARGEQLMMTSFETQTDQVTVCEASTQVEEDEFQIPVFKVEFPFGEETAVFPEVSPQKDAT